MAFPWDDITWVLLDMDGTLLDKHFDDYFWETLVPQEYARRQGMDLSLARDLVFARYQREEGTLNWTDIGAVWCCRCGSNLMWRRRSPPAPGFRP